MRSRLVSLILADMTPSYQSYLILGTDRCCNDGDANLLRDETARRCGEGGQLPS